ncbi:MAG: hypothetical protein ACN6O8_11085 [Achromobacter sp.]|uniref:hypothetical protein n=1 Tax=Achromobacter sp. TaxID=134375 RepID=UPI003CFED394
MTTTPPDPLAKRHDGTPDPDDQAPVDPHTQRLREENRALRELLAAHVQASIPRPGPLKRLGWWLISAPGAALVGWRSLVGREGAAPITGKRVGYATLTVLYTLAIYGALVLLVVSWSTPDAARSGASAAGPVRVPLAAPPGAGAATAAGPATAPTATPAREGAAPPPAAPALPKPTLRITEIPAEHPHAWVDALKTELARCATLGFFERPDCAWAARKQYCDPNQGWGAVKECPAQP